MGNTITQPATSRTSHQLSIYIGVCVTNIMQASFGLAKVYLHWATNVACETTLEWHDLDYIYIYIQCLCSVLDSVHFATLRPTSYICCAAHSFLAAHGCGMYNIAKRILVQLHSFPSRPNLFLTWKPPPRSHISQNYPHQHTHHPQTTLYTPTLFAECFSVRERAAAATLQLLRYPHTCRFSRFMRRARAILLRALQRRAFRATHRRRRHPSVRHLIETKMFHTLRNRAHERCEVRNGLLHRSGARKFPLQ